MIVIVFCHIIFEGGSQFSKNSPLTDLHSYTGCGERGGQCGGRERARPRAAAAAGQSAEPALGQDLAAGQDQRLVPDLPRGRGGHGPGRCTALYCTVLYCTVLYVYCSLARFPRPRSPSPGRASPAPPPRAAAPSTRTGPPAELQGRVEKCFL